VTRDRPRQLYTAAEAARALRIPPGTIRGWRAKGLLFEWGLTERGQSMYDRDDLIALRDGTKRRVQRAPRKRRIATDSSGKVTNSDVSCSVPFDAGRCAP
jgi:hypothetical protein